MSIWDLYTQHRVSPEITGGIRHADVVRMLAELQAIRPESMALRKLGESHEGRSISLATLGTGPTKVFAWSQMHGNEPTHTAVLLDLINFLQRFPNHPIAKGILDSCTLYVVLMLNPDGAERYTRRNAQSIDINRDALFLQTPEGKLLRQTVLDLQPDIALNLHNQTPRKSVGANPAQVAAVSLLVPPLDEADTQTEGTRIAKKLAGQFVGAVEPHCQGLISRYDADFMPRCFGEWVQQQGAATLTVEAGGWTTPLAERSPLVQIHFLGIVSVLSSIVDESYQSVDVGIYDQLPRSNEYDLFDVVVRKAGVIQEDCSVQMCSDIGINFQAISNDHHLPLDGIISDLGDLSVTNGKTEYVADGCICFPGRTVRVAGVTPENLPGPELVADLLRTGVTSVIGTLDLNDSAQLDALSQFDRHLALPMNLGFVADLGSSAGQETQSALLRAESLGILGIVGNVESKELDELLDCLGIVPIAHDTLSFAPDNTLRFADYLSELQQAALLLPSNAGGIELGSSADLVFFQSTPQFDPNQAIDWTHLQRVYVGGNVVWDTGTQSIAQGGRLLTNHFGVAAD